MATYLTTPLPADLPAHGQGFRPDDSIEHQVHSIAQHWLSQFELACATSNGELFASLFSHNSFWRDILAFTNDYRSIRTANIAAAANARFPIVKARDFVFTETQPNINHPFPDVTLLTLHFTFNTETGPAFGIAHLCWETDAWRAFTVFTLLEGVHGHPQVVGANRKRGTHNDKLSYDERRAKEAEFEDEDPQVLISECRELPWGK